MDKLPSDYESCGECGFDHEYEPTEANRWHAETNPVMHEKVCSEDDIRVWMNRNVRDHLDECGEVNCTSLVEAWDAECDSGEATLDEDHPAWTIAYEVFRDYEPMGV